MNEADTKQILIVEDDDSIREIIYEVLDSPEYTFAFAANGEEGLVEFNKQKPDIIILDMNMPRMGGLEFLEAIDLSNKDPWAVIVMTQAGDNQTLEICYKRGVAHFLHKPFGIYELKMAVENSLRLKDYTNLLETAVQERTAEIVYLQEFGQLLTTISTQSLRIDVQDLMPDVNSSFKQITEKIGADELHLEFHNADLMHLLQIESFEKRIPNDRRIEFHSWLQSEFSLNPVIFYPNIEIIQRPEILVLMQSWKIKGFIAIPMFLKNELQGYIAILFKDPIKRNWQNNFSLLRLIGELYLNLSESIKSDIHVKELLDMKEFFIAAISHELRTPLTVISDGISLLIDQDLGEMNEEQIEIGVHIRDNAKRLNAIVTRILDFRSLDLISGKLEMQRYSINQIIKNLRPDMEQLIKGKEITLYMDLCSDAIPVNLNADWIAKGFMNLYENAATFTQSGYIRIITECDGAGMKVSVEDTGSGIPESEISNLFQQFQQLGSINERKTGGIGIGLAMTRQIIQKHGGEIWVESEVGKGSTFSFYLPEKS